MNANFLSIVKKIVAEQGEAILADPQRLKGWISDYAKDEPRAERLAFGRCIEYGAYAELKNTPAAGRAAVKNRLAQRLYSEEGLDPALCAGALDLLEAALFGEAAPELSSAGNEWVTVAEQKTAGQAKPTAPPLEPVPLYSPPPGNTPPETHTRRNVLIVIAVIVVIGIASYFSRAGVQPNTAPPASPSPSSGGEAESAEVPASPASDAAEVQPNIASPASPPSSAIEVVEVQPNTAPPASSPKSSAGEVESASTYFQRGCALLDQKDYDGAIAAFTEAIRLDPQEGHYYSARGNAYLAKETMTGL
jgi:tetratricopeptide (TPR) repeat protein